MQYEVYSALVDLHEAVNDESVDNAISKVLGTRDMLRAAPAGTFFRNQTLATLETVLTDLKRSSSVWQGGMEYVQPISEYSSAFLTAQLGTELDVAMGSVSEQDGLKLLAASLAIEETQLNGYGNLGQAFAQTQLSQANSHIDIINNLITDLVETFKQRDAAEANIQRYSSNFAAAANKLDAELQEYWQGKLTTAQEASEQVKNDAAFSNMKNLLDVVGKVGSAVDKAGIFDAPKPSTLEQAKALAEKMKKQMAEAEEALAALPDEAKSTSHRRLQIGVAVAGLSAVSSIINWQHNIAENNRKIEEARAIVTKLEGMKDYYTFSEDELDTRPQAAAEAYRGVLDYDVTTVAEVLEELGKDNIQKMQAGPMAAAWDELTTQLEVVFAQWRALGSAKVTTAVEVYKQQVANMANWGKQVGVQNMKALDIVRKMQAEAAVRAGLVESAEAMKQTVKHAMAAEDNLEQRRIALVQSGLAMVYSLTNNALKVSRTLRSLCSSMEYDNYAGQQAFLFRQHCSESGRIRLPSADHIRSLLDSSSVLTFDEQGRGSPKGYMSMYSTAVDAAKQQLHDMCPREPIYSSQAVYPVAYADAARLKKMKDASEWSFELGWENLPASLRSEQPRIIGWVPVFKGLALKERPTRPELQNFMIEMGLRFDGASRVYKDATTSQDFGLPEFPMWPRHAVNVASERVCGSANMNPWNAAFVPEPLPNDYPRDPSDEHYLEDLKAWTDNVCTKERETSRSSGGYAYLYNLPSTFGKFTVSFAEPEAVEVADDAQMSILFLLQPKGVRACAH